jgi:nuclear pore complex protein Nup98-Nup96
VWSFKVDHFTTYGLDDDDETESEFLDESQMQQESSPLSDAPTTPTGQQDETLQSVETGTGEMEDTFQFKLDRRSQLSNIPGGFDSEGVSYDYDDPSADEGMDEDEHMMSGGLGDEEDPFVEDDRPDVLDASVHPRKEDAAAEGAGGEVDEQDMPGSFAELKMPRSILKPSRTLLGEFASPEKIATESWEDQLQRTMSPKKRDRQALKEMQKSLLRARAEDVIESPFKKSMLGLNQGGLNESYLAQRSAKKAKLDSTGSANKKELGRSRDYQTAVDIMNSMHGPVTKGRKIAAGGKGFEV